MAAADIDLDPRPKIDYAAPDFTAMFAWRVRRLAQIRQTPSVLPAMKLHYRWHPWDFVEDWGVTVDQRNPGMGQTALMPFVLFPRQREWIKWTFDSWQNNRPGVTVKSRDVGVSWLAIATSCALCLHWDDIAVGFGSRKLELVDKLGDPDSLFWKAREFLSTLPREFRGGWTQSDAPLKRIRIPATGSVMKGEGGDEIGRGGRSSLYFVDESSKLPHPMLIEASLSATTNCRIDIGTANGIGNVFYNKVQQWPAGRVFRFHWRHDPRKDDAWYAKQVDELDPVVVAQEIDIDFTASMEGVMIPSAWVQAAIGFNQAMGVHPEGERGGSLDVADEGADMLGFAGAHGNTVEALEEWSGKGGDIHASTVRTFSLCDGLGYEWFRYDADGLGAGVRGAARVVNQQRLKDGSGPLVRVVAYRGSAGVVKPDGKDVPGRKNEDFFSNLKAQAWWHARALFYNTWRARTQGAAFERDSVVSLNPDLKLLSKAAQQLSQPTFSLNNSGQVVVDKAPDGTKSPDLADAIVARLARLPRQMEVTDDMLRNARRAVA